MLRIWKYILVICCTGPFLPPCFGQSVVLVDHVGYETNAPKVALVMGAEQDHPRQFRLIDITSAKAVLSGSLVSAGQVKAWQGRVFWTADFSSWKKPGHYAIETRTDAGDVRSCSFSIDDDLLERNTLSNIVYYFKGQRASGLIDRADRHLPLPQGQPGFIDAHGGWYDATGDYGIHLSHQNLTSYFNSQQVPLVVWTLLKGCRVLDGHAPGNLQGSGRSPCS